MLKVNLLTIALLFFICMGELNATTYYVDNGGGNDGNSGTSESAAWNSLSKVNSFGFNSGDVVSFKCGDRFSGTTITNKSDITFNSYGTGARPVIDAEGAGNCVNLDGKSDITFDGLKFVNGTLSNINLWNCSNVTFESCNIDSSYYVPGHADYDAGSTTMNVYSGVGSNLTIRNCTMSYAGGSHGIYIDGTDNALLEYDTLMYNSHDGIRIGFGNDYDWTDNLTIRYCVSKFNKYAQLEEDGARNANIYYNVFEMDPGYYSGNNTLLHIHQDINYHCPQSNVYYYNNTFIGHNYGSHDLYSVELKSTSGMENIVFKNNIFYFDSNVKYGIYLENWYQNGVYGGLGSFVFTNNLYYTAGSTSNLFHSDFTSQSYSTVSDWQSATGYETNTLYVDPLFSNYNAGDYSIHKGSPAISSGTNVGLVEDISGSIVPSNNPDMGAYQHDTSGGPKVLSTDDLKNGMPKDFAIGQNYPNPFNPTTKIDYQVAANSKVILEVYNIAGQKVAELVNKDQSAGFYTVNFGGSVKLSSGVYIYRMTANDNSTGKIFSETKKMMLLK